MGRLKAALNATSADPQHDGHPTKVQKSLNHIAGCTEKIILVGYVGPRIDLIIQEIPRHSKPSSSLFHSHKKWRVTMVATTDRVIILQFSGLLYFLASFPLMVIITHLKPFEEILKT